LVANIKFVVVNGKVKVECDKDKITPQMQLKLKKLVEAKLDKEVKANATHYPSIYKAFSEMLT
jgi:hypothetical protein